MCHMSNIQRFLTIHFFHKHTIAKMSDERRKTRSMDLQTRPMTQNSGLDQTSSKSEPPKKKQRVSSIKIQARKGTNTS